MYFSIPQIYVDGASTATMMMDGYPSMTKQDSKNIFTFRFPKFTNSVVYDPTVDLGAEVVDNGAATGNFASVVVLAFCAMLSYCL